MTQATVENTTKARNADYNAAEKILMEQAPSAPIYQYTNGRLIKPVAKGYPINNPEDVAYSRTNVYCEARQIICNSERKDAEYRVFFNLRIAVTRRYPDKASGLETQNLRRSPEQCR